MANELAPILFVVCSVRALLCHQLYRSRMRLRELVAILLLVSSPALALDGPARVVDGDTIRIGQERVRLYGIDAPELNQQCGSQACGRMAADALRKIIDDQPLSCTQEDRDRYGRVVATCKAGGVDIGQAMVTRGMAVAYVKYSTRYLADEAEAKQAHLGLWAMQFDMPWIWREMRR